MTAFNSNAEDTLAWREAPGRALISLAWPIVLSLLSFSAMTIVDTWFVSRVGPAALAGTGLGGTLAFAALCFPLGLMRALKTLISQAIGAGRHDESHAYLTLGLAAALIQALFIFALGLWLAPVIASAAASAAAAQYTRDYFSIRLLGAFAVLCGSALQETRVALGDSRSSMRASLIANAVHVALAYLFILRFGFGVKGAAFATVLSQYLEALLLALAQRRDGFSSRGLGAHHLRAFWAMGWPTAVQFTLEIGSFAMLSFLVASFGELDMAAHQIGMQVQHLAFMPALALGEAASVLSARAVGAGMPSMVRGIAQRALAISAVHTGTCTLVLALWAAPIAGLFTHDAVLSALTIRVLHVACLFMVADASNVVARCVLRGTGDVRVPAVVGICSAWLLTPPLTYLLGRVLGYGVLGGWMGMTCEIVLGAVLLWLRLLGMGARVVRVAVAS